VHSAPLRARARSLLGRLRARWWGLWHRNIAVGEKARVGRGCRLRLDRGATLVLGPRCAVDDGTTLAVYGRGRLELGAGSFVGHHSTLAAHELVVIGAGAFLAEMVSVRDHDHVVGRPPSSGAVSVTSVHVGQDAWLGAKATVLRGAEVGDGAVVGAHAVVRGAVPAGAVAVGVPARVVRSAVGSGDPG
jgi:acetyltransferase-like isoleucine patch superfamily enzyme